MTRSCWLAESESVIAYFVTQSLSRFNPFYLLNHSLLALPILFLLNK
jgi:hypothetical protein